MKIELLIGKEELKKKLSLKDGKPGARGLPGREGPRGEKGANGTDGSPDSGEDIIVKVNTDKSDRLIRKGKVEGIEELEGMVRTAEANTRSWSNSGSFMYAQDLSSLLDGNTKTFNLIPNAHVVLVVSSSFPNVFRPTVDYTTSASTITFTSEISATTTLATGQTVIVLYKLV